VKILSEEKILNHLRKLSLRTGLTVNDLRVVLALERAIARIEADSNLAEHLIFKGGFLLFKSIDTTRYTRDADALAQGITPQAVIRLVKQALENDIHDCLWFGDIQVFPLPNQGPYGGLQFSIAFHITSSPPNKRQIKKLSRIHIDISFGELILFPKKKENMPSLIPELESVSWLVYPLESVFAEKLETLIRRGSANSRAKDIYDLIILFERCKNMNKLIEAITLTFSNRNMALPISFVASISNFDMNILERAWNSVIIVGPKKIFSEIRSELIRCLKKLDGLPAWPNYKRNS